jgi:hypothetical protein
MATIGDRLAGLATMSPARLRAEWRSLHRGQPMLEDMSTDMLARCIAWRWQEKALGTLPPARMRELNRLAQQLETSGELDLERQRQLKPGSRLVREWQGKVYIVTVLDMGYEFESRHYTSLTPIARYITGAAWSGPRFFGLAPRKGRGSDEK